MSVSCTTLKCREVACFMLPQAAVGQVYASKHYAWSGCETEQSEAIWFGKLSKQPFLESALWWVGKTN